MVTVKSTDGKDDKPQKTTKLSLTMPFLQNTRNAVRNSFLVPRSPQDALARILLAICRLIFFPKYQSSYKTFFILLVLCVIVFEWPILASCLSALRTRAFRSLARLLRACRNMPPPVRKWIRISIVSYIIFLIARIAITPHSIAFVVKQFIFRPPHVLGLLLGRGLKYGFFYMIDQLRQFVINLLRSLQAWYTNDIWNSETAWWIFHTIWNPYTIAVLLVIIPLFLIWLILTQRSRFSIWNFIFWGHLHAFGLPLNFLFPVLPFYAVAIGMLAYVLSEFIPNSNQWLVEKLFS